MAPVLDPANSGFKLIVTPNKAPVMIVWFRFIDDTLGERIRYKDIDDNSPNYFMETRQMCTGGPGMVIDTIPATSQVKSSPGSVFTVTFPVDHTSFGHGGHGVAANEVKAVRFVLPIERLSTPILTIDECFEVDVDVEASAPHLG